MNAEVGMKFVKFRSHVLCYFWNNVQVQRRIVRTSRFHWINRTASQRTSLAVSCFSSLGITRASSLMLLSSQTLSCWFLRHDFCVSTASVQTHIGSESVRYGSSSEGCAVLQNITAAQKNSQLCEQCFCAHDPCRC